MDAIFVVSADGDFVSPIVSVSMHLRGSRDDHVHVDVRELGASGAHLPMRQRAVGPTPMRMLTEGAARAGAPT